MSEFYPEISKLSSTPIWQFFDKICAIAHPSKHEEALAQYIIQWATEQGLEVRRDPTGNVFIKKPATPGMEHKKRCRVTSTYRYGAAEKRRYAT